MTYFRHFTVKKISLPLLGEKLSGLDIQWFAEMDAMCILDLWEKFVLASKFVAYCG